MLAAVFYASINNHSDDQLWRSLYRVLNLVGLLSKCAPLDECISQERDHQTLSFFAYVVCDIRSRELSKNIWKKMVKGDKFKLIK
jgi:hypothetical protein